MRSLIVLAALLCCQTAFAGAERPRFHLWLEPEWFDGVNGTFAYWTGSAKPHGAWGIAGPGISAEWTQGGESEWNSMGAAAEETSARCQRDIVLPRSGKYRIWVRYVDHRDKKEPFRVAVEQNGKAVFSGELGMQPVLPANDEYQLFWSFSFGWGSLDTELPVGPARLALIIDRAGQGWRQLDAVLVTDDLDYVPYGREKPPFVYMQNFSQQPKESFRATANPSPPAPLRQGERGANANSKFTMWTGVDPNPKWWSQQKLEQLTPYEVFFEHSPPADIRDKFHKQFAGRKDVPILSWPKLVPGFHLGGTPDFSPGSPLRQWFERTKAPFYILTNYATGKYSEKDGPETYAALIGPLADQFLGYIHGEAVGTGGVSLPHEPLAKDRRGHVDAVGQHLRRKQAEGWSAIYKTKVAEDHFAKSISCLSVDSIALAHLFHEAGAKTVGYEIDATNVHVPMRIAFERGAARQYGGQWINYASGNFGDACNYFTQNPVVPRGAGAWFHSKYSITDGVSASWYRKLYYLNYLSGASAIFWEQGLGNQWILPGPGTHPIQLSPFGRATEDFQAFVDRLPDRGEPYTPIALLLSYGHGYERVNYRCKMLDVFAEDRNDLELRELFNVCWHPTTILEGQPATPDVQSMPTGTYGNIFDVLVDRPERARAIFNYPIVWAAGDVRLRGDLLPIITDYVRKGGTLVVNVAACEGLPADLLGVRISGKTTLAEEWSPDGDKAQATTPFEVAEVELAGANGIAWAKKLPLITRHQVGMGAVIVTLVPNLIGQDERAHPCIPYLMNGLTRDLLPVEVRLADGRRPQGEIMYQLNRTKDGYLVALFNQRGIDKTQTGIARVDRRAFVDVVLQTKRPIRSAREQTTPRDLQVEREGGATNVRLRVPAGDVNVVTVVE